MSDHTMERLRKLVGEDDAKRLSAALERLGNALPPYDDEDQNRADLTALGALWYFTLQNLVQEGHWDAASELHRDAQLVAGTLGDGHNGSDVLN